MVEIIDKNPCRPQGIVIMRGIEGLGGGGKGFQHTRGRNKYVTEVKESRKENNVGFKLTPRR